MSTTKKKTPLTVLVTIIGVPVAFVMASPIVWLLMSSFKGFTELSVHLPHPPPEKFSLGSYANVTKNGSFQYVKNSLFLAVVGMLIILVISSTCSHVLTIYRHETPYANKVFAVFLLRALIPDEILTIPQFTIISETGLYNNIRGVILSAVTTTMGTFMYRQHFMTMPLSLAELARLDGVSEFKIFTSIMVPSASSVTVSLAIFSFVWRWNGYILPLVVLSDRKKFTIQIAIKSYIGTVGADWDAILASSIFSILLIVIILIFPQRYTMGGIATTGIKG